MATYSTGISVTWNAVAFQEVTGLSWTYGSGPSKGRTDPWTDDLGSVSVACLGTNNTAITNYGTRADVVISGGGHSLTKKAVWESVSVAPELNGVNRYTVTLKLLDS